MSLQTSLLRSVSGRSPLSESKAAALDDANWVLSECRRFSASLSEAKKLLMNLGSFVINKLQTFDSSVVENVVNDVTNFYVSCAVVVANIVAEWDQANQSDDMLPPVVPHQMVALSHSHFCTNVATHRDRLAAAEWTQTSFDTMEQQHKDLVRAIANEPALRSAVEACKDQVSFDDGWSVVKGRFESLQRFVGGIASVFPGTSQVESDFLIVKPEKDDFPSAITDLSLESVPHCKQFSMLAPLWTLLGTAYANKMRPEESTCRV